MAVVPNWSVVVPVKRLPEAKTRLREAVTGVPHDELVLALAADTVVAALRSDRVVRLIVVTDDPAAAAVLGPLGATVVADTPNAGLNPALRHGAAAARLVDAETALVVIGSDRPALRHTDLSEALGAASAYDAAFVADVHGTGTALLTAQGELDPRFGPDSAAQHRAAGVVPLAGQWDSLRHDTDTPADLAAALALGVGPHTSALLAHLST
jgi:2-phospho-L-lactate guanylyltransferase